MARPNVVTGCENGIVVFTQTMPAVKLYPIQSNKSSIPRVECGVTNEDIKFFIQSRRLAMQSWFLTLLEIVVVDKVLAEVVFITGSNCRYSIIWKSLSGKEDDEYALNKIIGEIFHGFAVI